MITLMIPAHDKAIQQTNKQKWYYIIKLRNKAHMKMHGYPKHSASNIRNHGI